MGRARKYPINEDYFKTWSHPMAYLLGFLMADGCVYASGKGQPCLSIHLATKDVNILHYIRDELSPTRPLYIKNESCRLKMRSRIICEDLAKHNIVPRKTGKEVLPKIPEEYRPTYLRGLFDGDGHISHVIDKRDNRNFKNQLTISMSLQSVPFLESVKEQLLQNTGQIHSYPKWSMSRLAIYTTPRIIKTGEYMYSTPGYYLQRKKQIFDQIERQI